MEATVIRDEIRSGSLYFAETDINGEWMQTLDDQAALEEIDRLFSDLYTHGRVEVDGRFGLFALVPRTSTLMAATYLKEMYVRRDGIYFVTEGHEVYRNTFRWQVDIDEEKGGCVIMGADAYKTVALEIGGITKQYKVAITKFLPAPYANTAALMRFMNSIQYELSCEDEAEETE